jgi:hypothetical protein
LGVQLLDLVVEAGEEGRKGEGIGDEGRGGR